MEHATQMRGADPEPAERRARAETEAVAAAAAERSGPPGAVARDEGFWEVVRRAYALDPTVVNLNTGGVNPAPVPVQQTMAELLELSNTAPAHVLWRVLEPRLEPVREDLAAMLGCAAGEVAITRNTSEGLVTCQLGFDLEPGDEVLASTQDYPRMLATWEQLEQRRGVVLRRFPLPVPAPPPEALVRLYESRMTSRTRLVLVPHVAHLTGQVFPVRDLVRMARRRGADVLVDGAHSFANLLFSRDDLECDFYATSLHKWLGAPHGTGLLHVRRERIREVWPLIPAPAEMAGDIRKFESIGTHPAANALSAVQAMAFHRAVGPERKLARLCHLRDLWVERLSATGRVELLTDLAPGRSCGLASFRVDGMDPERLAEHLWTEHRILVAALTHPEVRGIRVSAGIYTTAAEIDRFCGAVEAALRHGPGGS